MTQETTEKPKGLEGVIAGNTSASRVDGVNGRLIYRGYEIQDLAENASFEEVAYLIWNGDLPNRAQLKKFSQVLAKNRFLPKEIISLIRSFPKKAVPMDVLRTAVSALPIYDPDVRNNSPEANQRKAVRLLARCPSIVSTFDRCRRGKKPVAPDKKLSIAGNLLYMMTGKKPDPVSTRALDTYLVLLADHGFNASTFTSRVVVSTLSDMYSAVTAAIGALKGSLHGGANEKAMEMIRAIGSPEKADAYTRAVLSRHERVMGFGHRVYKTKDPRTKPLKEMARQLAEKIGKKKWYEISLIVEKIMMEEKNLFCNVDFYSATVLYSIDFPIDLFTTLFAVSRTAGWTAHIMEQFADNRLIRPKANYIGQEGRTFVPLGNR